MHTMKKVDFIGIGAAKAGTSFLMHALRAHPQICTSLIKETNFFMGSNPLAHDKLFKYDGRNIAKYGFYFKKCQPEQVSGEFSVHYMNDENAARKIHENFPNVKILAIIRDPVTRFISDYRFRKYMRNEVRGELSDMLVSENMLIRCGMYGEQLERYFALFPSNNIKVVIFEEMTKDPEGVIQKIYSFLDVDASFVPHDLLKKRPNEKWQNPRGPRNETRGRVRSMTVMKIAHEVHLAMIRAGLHTITEKLYERARGFVEKLNLKKMAYEDIDDATRKKIKELYVEDTRKLESLIQRDLSGLW